MVEVEEEEEEEATGGWREEEEEENGTREIGSSTVSCTAQLGSALKPRGIGSHRVLERSRFSLVRTPSDHIRALCLR